MSRIIQGECHAVDRLAADLSKERQLSPLAQQ